MIWPRISIVTPSYNHARFVPWTVRSVLHQRYPDLEYILMDGGSKDATVEVLAPYRSSFAHFVSERDKGQSDALCRGFLRSSGEIMAYLNSDDLLAPGVLHTIARYFHDHPEVDVVYGHRVLIDAVNLTTGYWMVPERHNHYLMMRWDMIPQETCFWRRRIWERAGNVDSSFRFAMDYDLFSRFMAAGARFAVLPRFLGAFRKHDEAKTTQLMDTVGKTESELIWNKHGLRPRWFHPLLSQRFYNGVHRRGMQHALSGRSLPGALPGIGYDYDRVWGSLLTSQEPPAPCHA